MSQGESSSAGNAGDVGQDQTGQLDTAAIGGIQAVQTRTATIQVLQVGGKLQDDDCYT